VKWLLNGTCLYVQGYTTEAGIRQKLKSDAIPVLFDEGEQQNERDSSRMQGVIGLARQSSTESEAMTLKGTVAGDGMEFLVRSMFLLSSVSVGIKYQADHDRIVKLHLKPKTAPGHRQSWPEIQAALLSLHSDKTMPARLARRAINLLPITLQNIEVFAEIAAKRLGSQREGDQFGTLLAGAWSLMSEKVATYGEAEALVDQYPWSAFLQETGGDESEKALNTILGHRIRMPSGSELVASELIAAATGRKITGYTITPEGANAMLKRYGLKVQHHDGQPLREGKLLLERGNKEIVSMLANTPFQSGWEDQIMRFEGAEAHRKPDGALKKERFAGNPTAAIFVKLSAILDDDGAGEPESDPSEDSDPI
jgi:putative DNA primase/helicase